MSTRKSRSSLDSCKHEYSDTFCRLGEVLLSFSSGILLLVTFGSSYWLDVVDESDALTHSGLWQTCTSDCSQIPLTYPGASAEVLVARTFMCLALASGMMAWVISIVGLLQRRARWLIISAVCYAVQGTLMALGLGSYSKSFSAKDEETTTFAKPGWSYSVGWVGCVLCLICTLCFVSVGVYLIKYPQQRVPGGKPKSYTPLAQFESTETDDDDDDENL